MANEAVKHLKILHTSGVHLGEAYFPDNGYRAHQTLDALVSLALIAKADLVIVAGNAHSQTAAP